jgi:DNA-binding transcriptional ArsR family regulator
MCASAERHAIRGLGGALRLMPLSVDRETAGSKSRLTHVSLLALNLRLMENWRSIQIATRGGALDYESTMIVMAIIVIGAEKLLRADLDPELQSLAHRLPLDRLSAVNFSSIAAATGINRETVRRKVSALQEAGMVIRDEDGIRMQHGVVTFEVLHDIIDAQLDAITRTVNQLSTLGVLVTSDSSDR